MADKTITIELTTAQLAKLACHLTMAADYTASAVAIIESATGIPFRQLVEDDQQRQREDSDA